MSIKKKVTRKVANILRSFASFREANKNRRAYIEWLTLTFCIVRAAYDMGTFSGDQGRARSKKKDGIRVSCSNCAAFIRYSKAAKHPKPDLLVVCTKCQVNASKLCIASLQYWSSLYKLDVWICGLGCFDVLRNKYKLTKFNFPFETDGINCPVPRDVDEKAKYVSKVLKKCLMKELNQTLFCKLTTNNPGCGFHALGQALKEMQHKDGNFHSSLPASFFESNNVDSVKQIIVSTHHASQNMGLGFGIQSGAPLTDEDLQAMNTIGVDVWVLELKVELYRLPNTADGIDSRNVDPIICPYRGCTVTMNGPKSVNREAITTAASSRPPILLVRWQEGLYATSPLKYCSIQYKGYKPE